MRFDEFCGATYTAPSTNVDVEKCMNFYPELHDVPGATPKSRLSLMYTPGLLLFANIGAGPIRAIFYQDGRLFVVSGAELYEVSAAATGTLLGSVEASTQPASISSNGGGGNQLFIVSGSKGYTYILSTGDFAVIADVDFPTSAVMGGFSDGYSLVLRRGTTQFYFSALNNSISWDALDVAQKSQSSDNIRALIVDHKEVWLLGSKTTEVWYNNGNADNPFTPIQGVLIEHGIGPIWSWAKINNTIAWIGQDAEGYGVGWLAQGYVPTRFTTHAVEYAWKQYGTIEDAIAWAYQENGHSFYVVYFPTAQATWAYDFATQMWHERGRWNLGVFEAHLGRSFSLGFDNILLVGSRIDGKLYKLSSAYLDDDGSVIRRVRRAPIITNENKWLMFHSFELAMNVGVGLTSGQGSDPQVMLRWSNDNGKTWSNEYWMGAGALGGYNSRVSWSRLGRGRNRVFEVSMSDAVKWELTSASLNTSAARH